MLTLGLSHRAVLVQPFSNTSPITLPSDMRLFATSFHYNRLALSTDGSETVFVPNYRRFEFGGGFLGTADRAVGTHKWKCTGRSVKSMTAVVQCALLILAFLPQTHPCGMEIASPTNKAVIQDYAMMSTDCQNEITGCSARLLLRRHESGESTEWVTSPGPRGWYHHCLVENTDCRVVQLARRYQFQSPVDA